MVHIRQPYFSIFAAILFGALGLIAGMGTMSGSSFTIGTVELSQSVTWAFTGVMFLMSYFSLVHLGEDKK